MAQLNSVRPGDLIKADDWNALVTAVQGLSGPVQPGGIVVPSLFGMTLNAAVAIIRLPSSQLNLGSVLNSYGETVDPSSPDAINLLVLGQSPSAAVSVSAASSVNLVVSPSPGSPSTIVQQLIVGVSQVQPGKYDAGSNTITLNKGATIGAVAFSVITPNTDSYSCQVPASFGSGWGASIISNQKFQPGTAGVAVGVTVRIQPVGSSAGTLTFSVSSDSHSSLSASVSPTVVVSTT